MRIVVIGSGVAASHAALTLLERGLAVEVWDIGRQEVVPEHPGVSLHGLKSTLEAPTEFFLGRELEALIPPGTGELLRYPPARRFLLSRQDPHWPFVSDDHFKPYLSYSTGGLANGWGANALAYAADDLRGWPLTVEDWAQDYATVARRIPIAGPTEDDLTPYLQGIEPNQPPVALNAADAWLLARYRRKRRGLNARGVYLGHSRMAVRTASFEAGHCDACDRCLWGCPRQAIYEPARDTLRRCNAYTGFVHRPNRLVTSLSARDGRITGIRYLDLADNRLREEPCDAVFLAAGALGSGIIFLNTLAQSGLDLTAESEGLMDTQVVKLPYVALGRIGKPSVERSFQFNRLDLGYVRERGVDAWPRYLHGEVLHLTGLLYHPLIESLPLPTRWGKRLFFALKSALGVVTLFFPDRLTAGNRLVLEESTPIPRVRAVYAAPTEQRRYWGHCIGRVQRALLTLGCLPKGAAYSPPGGGIHYAGTIPMGEGPKRCNAQGRSNLYANLYIADGAAFPSLPSKSITLNLAAHATRVARLATMA